MLLAALAAVDRLPPGLCARHGRLGCRGADARNVYRRGRERGEWQRVWGGNNKRRGK